MKSVLFLLLLLFSTRVDALELSSTTVKLGIGTTSVANTLSIGGGTAIGSTFSSQTAPTDGLVVQGNVGIGTVTPLSPLIVLGGNVGIGTWSPVFPLEIKAPGSAGIVLSIQSANVDTQIKYANTSTGGNAWLSGATGNGDSSGVGFVWYNQSVGSPKMIITNAGNVGIGTTIPQATLEVKGTFRTIGAGTSPWTKKSGANTACDTTCSTSQCAFGEDSAVLGTLLACSDATADVCVCTGP